MRSLTAHLTAGANHGQLSFHPECPVCRASRLAGGLPAEPIVPQRAQAALLAGVLAISAGGPAAGIAAADTPGGEGTAAPGTGDGAGQQTPGFDPGGEVPLPNEFSPPPAPVAGGDDDSPGGPVEGETNEQLRAPAATGPPQAAAPAAPGTTAPSASVPAPAATRAPTTGAPEPQPPDTPASRPEKREPKNERRQERAPDSPGATPSAPPAAAPGVVATRSSSGNGPATSGTSSGVAETVVPDGADTYVVRSGDTLWSIARGLLGTNASAAQVAREVHRLWELNADRIGTGNPNLIMAGQTLRLR